MGHLSSLESLQIDADSIQSALGFIPIVQAVVLPHLATVFVKKYLATISFLAALASYPSLREIKTTGHEPFNEDCDGNHAGAPILPTGAFPSLHTLTMSGCRADIQHLANDPNFPTNIKSLTIEIYDCNATVESHKCEYDTAVEKCAQLTEVVLRYSMEYSPSFWDLGVFFTKNLTTLTVHSAVQVTFTASEVEEIIHSLPSIETFCMLPYDGDYDTLIGPFTLRDLDSFIECCPRLQELRIIINTTSPIFTPSPHDIPPFSPLKILDIGWSFLSEDSVEEVSVALAQILPRQCTVLYTYDVHESWIHLVRMLPALRRVMEFTEERARCARAVI
ncbi:hypothetical protein H0H87_006349 [Tephrocybe sp. NHM501043]|nr:hypothetical protein H0H87_006349 [Tephrocybe sp. NHM501043]